MPDATPLVPLNDTLARARRWGVAAGVVAVGLGLLVTVAAPGLNQSWFLAVNQATAAWPQAMAALTVLGLGSSVILLAAAAGPSRSRWLATMFIAVVVGGLLVQLVKFGLAVPRPLSVLGPDAVHVVGMKLTSRAMPSGHSAAIFALLGALLFNPGLRPALAALAVPLAVAVAASRMGVGAHWPGDVLVGSGLGLITGAGLTAPWGGARIVSALDRRMRSRVGSRLMAALLVVVAGFVWVGEIDQPDADWVYRVLAAAGVAAAVAWWRLNPGRAGLALTSSPDAAPQAR
jgi:membrane-associated phospholipid phosphatase